MSEEKENKIEKEKSEYTLVEVPTQMGLAFETPDKKILTQEQLLVEIANNLYEIKKTLA